MTREIGLVSCVKSKRDEPAKPRELYTSAYFEKMRAYAEQEHDEWWILSAKHGLLDPDGSPIDPYNETLSGPGSPRNATGRTASLNNYRTPDSSNQTSGWSFTRARTTTRNSSQNSMSTTA